MENNNSIKSLREKLRHNLKKLLKQDTVREKELNAFDKLVSRRNFLANSGRLAVLGALVSSGLVPSAWAGSLNDKDYAVGTPQDIGITPDEIATEGGTYAPVIKNPLIVEPYQPYPSTSEFIKDRNIGLGPLFYLVGTWTNQNLPNIPAGGRESPFSYNVMPLPQRDTQSGKDSYILKNFSYYEELTFSPIYGTAPNRGGNGTQVSNTLFYEQRVYFAEGPAKDTLVHAENGTLCFLTDRLQLDGPYGAGNTPMKMGTKTLPGSKVPTQSFNIFKQLSVPHGNSILAEGNFEENEGTPTVPTFSRLEVYPTFADSGALYSDLIPYSSGKPGNPQPATTLQPNLPLRNALKSSIPPQHYIKIIVDTKKNNHNPQNIGFEQKNCAVTDYSITYWLESFSSNNKRKYEQLQYSQAITMEIPLNGKIVRFPHITTNTLRKKDFS